MFKIIKTILPCIAAVGAILFPMVAHAQIAVPNQIDLASIAEMYFNADPQLAIDHVSSPEIASRFTPVGERPIWTGSRAKASWLRFVLPIEKLGSGYGLESDPKERVDQWVLLVKPSFSIILDDIQLYVPRQDGGFDVLRTGARVKSTPGELHSRFFFFELPASAFAGQACYLRISSDFDVIMTISLVHAVSFVMDQALGYLGYGIIFGALIAMIFYSLFMLNSLHYRSYIYYILYTVTVGLWLFYVQGFSKVLFGQMPGIDQKMLWIWTGQYITWGTIFSISFLELRQTNRVLFIIMTIAAILSVIVSLAGLMGFYAVAFTLSHMLGIAVPALIIIAAVVRLHQGYRSASYYLVGWSFMAIGGVVFSLMGFQVLPVHPLTVNALSIGIVFESVFLAMALFDRFKMLEKEKEKLKAEQAHYRELSLTDALTGLKNRRYLMMELQNAIQFSLQHGEPLSVISLDIDDFKKINDRFGHEIGDDILIALAHSIRSCTRETDAACLYGGDEIIIFMPNTSKDRAYAIAERIRMHFEVESLRVIDGASLAATISLGIVEFEPAETIDALLSRADDAMYRAKRRGKNCSVAI